MQTSIRNCLMYVAALSLVVGCGGGGVERPDRTSVSGTVTFAGVPVTDALVVFSPAGEGRGATGITDSNGNFVMGTFEKADGALPGDYIVLVSKLEQPESSVEVVSEDDPAYNGAPTREQEETEAKNLLPVAFSKRESSNLTATVGTEPIEGLKFDLGS
tara:strand:+ start:68272 stop:68748 length:477 start_codon:yes stop_codon:yes gene_type:complete